MSALSNEPAARPFVSAHSPANSAVTLLIICAVFSAVAAFWRATQTTLVSRIIAGERVTETEAVNSDGCLCIINVLQLVVLTAAWIAFLRWVYRAYKVLPALGAEIVKYTPGWAVIWFYVPVLNWILPIQVMTELWIKSGPQNPGAEGPNRPPAPTPLIFPFWWMIWLATSVISVFAASAVTDSNTLDAIARAIWLEVVADGAIAAAMLFTIVVVNTIDKRQQETITRLGLVSADAPQGFYAGR
jgi:hypothetical protein